MPKRCPAPASRRRVLAGLRRADRRSGAAQRSAARQGATTLQRADRCMAPGAIAAKPIDPTPIPSSCAVSAICCRSRRISRSRPTNVDPEIASIAGPQLVVPVTNARYALNAANARWGSLYDALYGTDAIPEDGGATRGGGYNSVRGAAVIAKARQLLDQAAPLAIGSHARRHALRDRQRAARGHAEGQRCDRACAPGAVRRLSRRDGDRHQRILLKHNGLHIEIVIDRTRPIGQQDRGRRRRRGAGSGDHHDPGLRGFGRRRRCRRQGRGIPQLARPDAGHLAETFDKDGETVTRRLMPTATTPRRMAARSRLPGRSLMLVRNVGHHMYTDAVRDAPAPRCRRGCWMRRSPR